MNSSKFFKVIKIIAMVILFGAIMGWVVMSLWNWLMPYLFAAKLITYWQALGILILCKILFGGIKSGWRGRYGHYQGDWKQKMESRMAGMSEEERENFKKQFYSKCNKKWNCDFPEDEIK
ncbi:MAG: hypothetical protein ABI723_02710 [Bacteroidia bacterium]